MAKVLTVEKARKAVDNGNPPGNGRWGMKGSEGDPRVNRPRVEVISAVALGSDPSPHGETVERLAASQYIDISSWTGNPQKRALTFLLSPDTLAVNRGPPRLFDDEEAVHGDLMSMTEGRVMRILRVVLRVMVKDGELRNFDVVFERYNCG
ncbi:hypothetical protein BDZ91DRAFT_766502 [Kalaharituber pfeilii]|nr:hypothetical protein BDZ91DRAFT_766502 [Kalaharituber pfeilii]